MKALLLGNSPALNHVNFEKVDRSQVTVFGVNRLWHRDDARRRWIIPDYYCALEDSMEEEWVPPVGAIRAFIAWDKTHFVEREDAYVRERGAALDGPWPAVGEPYLKSMLTPEFLFQFILELPVRRIAVLGIDYTASGLAHLEMETHCWGTNGHAASAPSMGDGTNKHTEEGLCFWLKAKDECERRGILLENLSPFEDAPFHKAGLPRRSFDSWCEACSPSS